MGRILFLRLLNQAGDSGRILRDFMLPAPMEIWSNFTLLRLALRNSLEYIHDYKWSPSHFNGDLEIDKAC